MGGQLPLSSGRSSGCDDRARERRRPGLRFWSELVFAEDLAEIGALEGSGEEEACEHNGFLPGLEKCALFSPSVGGLADRAAPPGPIGSVAEGFRCREKEFCLAGRILCASRR